MAGFPALPGFYRFVFMYFEPASTVIPLAMMFFPDGVAGMLHVLVPSDAPPPPIVDPRTHMVMCHLVGLYLLIGLVSTFVFRTAKNALGQNPVAQERVVGAVLGALSIADVNHLIATSYAMPKEFLFDVSSWNIINHANLTFVAVLFLLRVAWFLGIGRKRYYFGQQAQGLKKRA